MDNTPPHTYEDGLREGRLNSLEKVVKEHTADLKLLNKAVYLLYGAIALIQFVFPFIESRML